MGLLFVLILWGFVGSIVATIGALVLRAIAAALVGKERSDPRRLDRHRVIQFATLLPFACLVWAGIILVFQGFINTEVLHRDIGLGDEWYCPLQNGYSLVMIDVDDEGTIYRSTTQSPDDMVSDQDGIAGVRELQIAGAYILGASDSKYPKDFGQNDPPVDRYFIVNSRTGNRVDYPNDASLRTAAASFGIALNLRTVSEVYNHFRYTWFDFFAAFLLIVPPLIGAGFLLKRIMQLRRVPRI